MIEGRTCFNGAEDVVKKALEGAGAAKARVNWEAARKQLLLAIEGAAMMGGGMLVPTVLAVGEAAEGVRDGRWHVTPSEGFRELGGAAVRARLTEAQPATPASKTSRPIGSTRAKYIHF